MSQYYLERRLSKLYQILKSKQIGKVGQYQKKKNCRGGCKRHQKTNQKKVGSVV